MKKHIILTLLALATLGLRAQMDSVLYGDPRYFWPGTQAEYTVPAQTNTWGFLNIGFMKCFTPQDTLIHGLSLFSDGSVIDPQYGNVGIIYMKIFQKDSLGNIILLDSTLITLEKIERAKAYPKWYVHDVDTAALHNVPELSKLQGDSLLEFYFDHPITVHDTFFTGFSLHYHPQFGSVNLLNSLRTFSWYYLLAPSTVSVIGFAEEGYYPPSQWDDMELNVPLCTPTLGVFPILAPTPQSDTVPPCPAPDAPVLIDTTLGSATLLWQCSGDSCQLHLTAPGLDTLITQGTSLTLLTPGVSYTATLRTLCHHICYDHDTTQWSPWSQALTFRVPARDTVWNTDTLWINDSTGVIGGELVVLDSNATLLIVDGHTYIVLGTDTLDYNDPRLTWIDNNTAVLGGTLVVVSSGNPNPQGIISPDGAMILRQEYYDLLGRRLAQPPARGLYLLRTVTTNGASTRKIIKQ